MNFDNFRWMFWLVQSVQCLVVAAWIVCTLIALVGLRKQKISDTARAVWALLIVLIPVLGAVAYWIVAPQSGEAVG
ncbi:MAG: PLDc N-terminal domain-containing protein [Anaerolineales bacterium]